MSWLTDLRKIALVAGIAEVVSAIYPTWSAAQQALGTLAMIRGSAVTMATAALIAGGVLGLLHAALIPVFCFALYRDRGTLILSPRLRQVGVAAAWGMGVVTAFDLRGFFRPFAAASENLRSAETLGISGAGVVDNSIVIYVAWTLIGLLGPAAYILLLLALSRHTADDETPTVPASKLLRVTAGLAVIGWGLLIVLQILRIGALPFTLPSLSALVDQAGQPRTLLFGLWTIPAMQIVSAASLYAAPYIVCKSFVRTAAMATPSEKELDAANDAC